MGNIANRSSTPTQLHRGVGVGGATLLGLGSIIGTGVFVSLGVAADVAGPAVLLAIAIAALLAACNALSSAQLAAAHPVSGGAYEYGHIHLTPTLGFIAGWTFLCAKSASAATAALGFAGYLLHAMGVAEPRLHVPLAVLAVIALTAVVLGGIRRSSAVNIAIVSVTIASLAAFVLFGLPSLFDLGGKNFTPLFNSSSPGQNTASLLNATALMFVAYTGYGRIATLGEEVIDPARTIPRAIIITLLVSATLYLAVGVVAIGTHGAPRLGMATTSQAAMLDIVAQDFRWPQVHWLISAGAVTAMAGVLLNLILGLSRVMLAMGRRRDLPRQVAVLDAAGTTPRVAVIAVGVIIAGLTMIGSVKTTWAFSAFTVLVYYAINNAAALRMPKEARRYPPIIAWTGLLGCIFLAFWVPVLIWACGLALIAIGLLARVVARRVWPQLDT